MKVVILFFSVGCCFGIQSFNNSSFGSNSEKASKVRLTFTWRYWSSAPFVPILLPIFSNTFECSTKIIAASRIPAILTCFAFVCLQNASWRASKIPTGQLYRGNIRIHPPKSYSKVFIHKFRNMFQKGEWRGWKCLSILCLILVLSHNETQSNLRLTC